MKKVLIGIVVFFVVLIGGTTIFVQTKSDFIIQKVSELLEQNLNAKLTMQELPKISVFPSISVSAGNSSLVSDEYTITFKNASVAISLFKLLSGTVQVNSISLEDLNLVFDTSKSVQKTSKTAKTENAKNTEKAKSLEEIFALIPAEISIKNSNILYKDKEQEINIQNLNADFQDFGINKNSSTKLDGSVAYKDKSQDIAFNLVSDIDFLFMGTSIEYTINSFTFTPQKGLPLTKPVDITAQSAMSFSPLLIENINATIKSPFVNLQIYGNGNDEKGDVSVKGEFYPLNIQESLIPEQSFNNLPKTASLDSSFTLTPKAITIKQIAILANNTAINLKGSYSLSQNTIDASLVTENININDFLPKDSAKNTNAKQNSNEAENSAKTPSKASTQSANKIRFIVDATLKNTSYNALLIDSIKSKITGIIQGGLQKIALNPLSISSNNETINAIINADLSSKDIVSVNYDIPKLSAKHWTKAISEKAPLDALVQSKGSINFKTANPLATLNGTGEINGSALKVETKLLPFIASLLKASPKLEDSYEFSKMHAPFTINNGLLTTQNTYVDSDVILVNASGSAHLAKNAINMGGAVELKKQYITIPYKVSGALDNPSIGIDLAKQLEVIGGGLLNGGKAVGGGIVEGGKTVGGGLLEGGKAIGGGLIEGGKALEKGITNLFK